MGITGTDRAEWNGERVDGHFDSACLSNRLDGPGKGFSLGSDAHPKFIYVQNAAENGNSK